MRTVYFDGNPPVLPDDVSIKSVKVGFSPFEDLEAVVLSTLSEAKSEILISCYGLANQNIAGMLIDKHKAGVVVRVCEDHTQAAGVHDQHQALQDAGIEVVIKPSRLLEHNKVAIIDRSIVITGSWNFSKSANKQDNNIEVFRDEPEVVDGFVKDWQAIYSRDKS